MKELRKYFREIKTMLPCNGSARKKILHDIQFSVENFLQENPDATFEAVTDHFGTPEEIAGSYAEEMPPQELQRKLKIQRWIIGIIAGTATCALIAWLSIVGIAISNYVKGENGILEVEPVVVEEDIVFEEEVVIEEDIVFEEEVVIEEDIVVEENVGEASDLEG